jgi:signal transduction histidine kinase
MPVNESKLTAQSPALNGASHRPFPGEQSLLTLAPLELPNFHPGRYTAEDERRTLEDFSGEDRDLLARVYEILVRLYDEMRPVYSDLTRVRAVVGRFVREGELDRLIAAIQAFGVATEAEGRVAGIERNIHDLRGGAMQALCFRLEMAENAEGADAANLTPIFFLLRDHLKIMRNNVCDLDAERFAQDQSPQSHDASLLLEKWARAEFHGAAVPVRVELHGVYDGALCESCLEFSTLDRIIYNLMNNAARYAADGLVHFSMLPLPGSSPRSVRFVIGNYVAEAQREKLRERFGDRLGQIFAGGFTTGGHGLGLRICADFCTHAFGLADFEAAREKGYFGATWMGDYFTVWFHWPIEGGEGAVVR